MNYSTNSFICLPSASDAALLEEAFAIVGEIYLSVWNVCEGIYSISSTSPGDRTPEINDYYDAARLLDRDELYHLAVKPELRHRASLLGLNIDPVFRVYVRNAIYDHGQRVTLVGHNGPPYTPWFHFGLSLPIENVSIETTEDGVDWLRFGEIGPIPFDFTLDSIPDWADKVTLMPPEFECCEEHDDENSSPPRWEITFNGDSKNTKSQPDLDDLTIGYWTDD